MCTNEASNLGRSVEASTVGTYGSRAGSRGAISLSAVCSPLPEADVLVGITAATGSTVAELVLCDSTGLGNEALVPVKVVLL